MVVAASPIVAVAPHAARGRVPRAVGIWLLAVCALVFAMVVVGGVTRLSGSGLSMVHWHPVSGAVPPLDDRAWAREFDAYRLSPEGRTVNSDYDLAQFKRIFWVEYAHRMLGRLIGLVFAVPFLIFALRGQLERWLTPRLLAVFVLGGLQGLMGWYMVKSGLVDEPRVSQYRLAAHLALAVVIYASTLYLALCTLRSRPARGELAGAGACAIVVLVLFATIVAGAFVAGLDAGLVYPTFPMMGTHWAPPGMGLLEPLWLNLLENPVTVQFVHRHLGYLTMAATVALCVYLWRATRARPVRALALAAVAGVFVQAALGVAALLSQVELAVAASHQAGAMILLTILVALLYECRHRLDSG